MLYGASGWCYRKKGSENIQKLQRILLMDGEFQKVHWEGFLNGGVVESRNRLEDVQSYMENRMKEMGFDVGVSLVADTKRIKGHKGTHSGGLQANNDL